MAGWKERYLQFWQKLSKRQKYIIAGVGALLIFALIGASFFYGSEPEMQPLFTNMETKDAGEVAAKLKEEKVQYKIEENKSGTTILVPAKDVHKLRLDMAVQGLPRGTKGFEIFDNSKLGVTDFQNKVNYLQALQGELTRTIEQIDAVQSARVHIVLPEDSLYKKNEKPATASILLRLKPGKELNKKEIKGIVNLTAHSVQGLQAENVTIIDSHGRILNDPNDNGTDDKNTLGNITLTQIKMTQRVRQQMQTEVQTLLDNALGEGNAFVRVNVALDFDQKQTDKQTFSPVVDDAGILRSSQETSESYKGTSTTPGGPAGMTSNTPGYVANNNTNAQYSKQEATKNYEINEQNQKVISAPGTIKRLNIAVLVSDKMTRQQQQSIARAVASAAGIDPDRGDTISVEPVPFSTAAADKRAQEEQASRDAAARMFYLEIAAIVLPLMLLAIAYYIYKKRKRIEAQAAQEEMEHQAEMEQERLAMGNAENASSTSEAEEELSEEEQTQLNERQTVEKMIDQEPEQVAELIKTWLAEE
ncbi:flagellar basal-body MS-ring/collar protein FliF [Pectinatus sottacetonis]|uniref:flagellar basal-body MS-ring/collar protein FliF n=1 Tax=Pectinatus sottacetonis TaxID=1002795 RepID=UPI0018C50903|nr:flagellar basal-body MS-ring/collar protein FliF [Pectinatus sottacetonis]